MPLIKYTPEQADILDWFAEPQEIIPEYNGAVLLVEAGAGSGKSFMSYQVVKQENPETCLYTAFNKAIVEEGKARFKGTNVSCRTFHSLAYHYVKPRNKIQELTYADIKEKISYSDKAEILKAINMFFVSASTDMYEYFEEFFKENPKQETLAELSSKYVEKMIEEKISPSFNFLLKYFHLMLVNKEITVNYDIVILDEINDTTSVALEIFKLIKAPKKLGLGETHQAIYDFLNLVNGFEVLDKADTLKLTQSFRCSALIAKNIQRFMKAEVNKDFKFVGTEEPIKNGLSLYCTLTNSKIIQHIADRLTERKGFNLLRNISEIFAYPLAIVSAGRGKKVYQKKYKFLEEEYENYCETKKAKVSFLQHLLEHVDDPETKSAVNLLMTLQRRSINIFDIYNDAKTAEVDATYTIATVFTAKGLEYETVHIADDLNNRIDMIRNNGGIITREDLVAYRCYYVAASRAGTNLHNAIALNTN